MNVTRKTRTLKIQDFKVNKTQEAKVSSVWLRGKTVTKTLAFRFWGSAITCICIYDAYIFFIKQSFCLYEMPPLLICNILSDINIVISFSLCLLFAWYIFSSVLQLACVFILHTEWCLFLLFYLVCFFFSLQKECLVHLHKITDTVIFKSTVLFSFCIPPPFFAL